MALSSEDILKDKQARSPCRKFLQIGICDFGTSCRFSHMSEADMFHLRKKVENENQRLEGSDDPNALELNVEIWLSNREKRKSGQTGISEDRTPFDIPPQIFSVPDLPRSLVPPSSGGWKVDSDMDWG
ncbi:zinc finger matrin-type protein 5-like [Corythoichthys intestinalis]|uniref:zinc finger matrin-type protein 5-like n=1 Tax=Corythoichthys intestinalis TaxID=161448 RepID=UPI0025A685B3|nr:zinc finger matrin-type protein 5-like [Corythoichthys intestinalis]